MSSDINEQRALAIEQHDKKLDEKLKSYDETLRKIFEGQAKFNEEIKLLMKEKKEN